MVSGYPTSTSFPQVDDWSMDPQVLGRHIIRPGSQVYDSVLEEFP